MVSRHAVRTKQGEVLDIGCGLRVIAINSIFECDGALAISRHLKSQSKRLTGSGTSVALFLRKVSHVSVEKPCALRGARLFAVAFTRGREVAVSHALLKDRFGHSAMKRQALGLFVFLIPGETEPL